MKTLIYLIFLNILINLITGAWFSPAIQGNNQWSLQQRVPGYGDETYPPMMVADQNRTVHAFTSQWIGEDQNRLAIMYNQWSLNQGWTNPIDILLSPLKNEARLLGTFLDETGTVHLVFFGGDNTQADIYYAKAPAASAGKVSAWSTPLLIGEGALNPESGAINGDGQGNMVILFGGYQNGNGLYSVVSADYGESWSDPELVYLTEGDQFWPFDCQVYFGPSGQLHAVWSVYDSAGHGVSVLYAQYNFQQGEWSDPVELASSDSGLGVSLSNVVEHEGEIIVIYYNGASNAIWMRKSIDEGSTWTDPIRIAPRHIGRNGVVSLVIDSDDVLHLFFGERIPGDPDIHGMWHSVFRADQWTEPEPVVSGPRVSDTKLDKGFDPYDARAVVSQGNVILVTWRTDPGDIKPNGVHYSFVELNTPELPATPLPTEQLVLEGDPVTTVTPSDLSAIGNSQPLPSKDLTEFSYQTYADRSRGAMIMGAGLAAVFTLFVVAGYVFIHRRQD